MPPDVARRNRIPKELPAPPECLEFAWAKCRDHFKGADWGEIAYLITQSPRYQATVARACSDLDRGTRAPQARAYTTAELESLNLLRRLLGKRSCRETRDWLTSDRGEKARQLLGFDKPRLAYGAKQRQLMNRVPSEATMSRHHSRFSEDRREAAWRAFFEAGRDKNLEDLAREAPEVLLFVPIDGSAMRIHYQAPIRNSKTGELVNEGRITAPEAGYKALGPGGDPGPQGMASRTSTL